MKTLTSIARYLLGTIFTVFGLNGFFHFIPMGPVPALAGQFAGALAQSHYMDVVMTLQIVSGLLLLANRYVALALAILAPILVNIFLFHALMAPAGLPLAAVVSLLWGLLAYQRRAAFAGLFEEPGTASPRFGSSRPAPADVS